MRFRPHFKHDCASCVLLGSVREDGHLYDLYFHPSKSRYDRAVLARYSDAPPAYRSMDLPEGISGGEMLIERRRWYRTALRRAERAGLYDNPRNLDLAEH